MVKLVKKLNIKRVVIALVLLVVLILIVVFIGSKLINSKDKDKKEENKVEHEIKDYGYVLLENETNIHKEYFKELIKVLNEEEYDEKEYASLVVKLFVTDFYELNSKTTKNDVGGLQYVYDKTHENFVLNAKDTIYKYVENNLDGKRTQKLPSVKSVNIESTDSTTFKYEADGITDDQAYTVKATWEYNEDLGYQKQATFTLMHVDKKLVIVEIK